TTICYLDSLYAVLPWIPSPRVFPLGSFAPVRTFREAFVSVAWICLTITTITRSFTIARRRIFENAHYKSSDFVSGELLHCSPVCTLFHMGFDFNRSCVRPGCAKCSHRDALGQARCHPSTGAFTVVAATFPRESAGFGAVAVARVAAAQQRAGHHRPRSCNF